MWVARPRSQYQGLCAYDYQLPFLWGVRGFPLNAAEVNLRSIGCHKLCRSQIAQRTVRPVQIVVHAVLCGQYLASGRLVRISRFKNSSRLSPFPRTSIHRGSRGVLVPPIIAPFPHVFLQIVQSSSIPFETAY